MRQVLKFYAELPEQEWDTWISLFKTKATLLLERESILNIKAPKLISS
ncbi:hypothetical protein [Clostridium intestinale]|nr:hypothetical protein [Clostridium intestinale]